MTQSASTILPQVDGVYPEVIHFDLPTALEASAPPEARGLARDEVRLMVSYRSDNRVIHTQFRQLSDYLHEGDVLVINTSGTMNAAVHATRADGMELELHLSTRLPSGLWIVEVRVPDGKTTRPFKHVMASETLSLPGGASATLHTPYQADGDTKPSAGPVRLWIATLQLPSPYLTYLACHGYPIRYSYVQEQWPGEYYQSVYVTEMGSAEMPSAGRAFTCELITHLVARGIQIAPLLLHTGVASLEEHEPPYEEYYHIAPATANIVNGAHTEGRRIIAVGTTVVRALETATDIHGFTHPGEGWTRMIITPERGVRAINGLLTGLHEPQATHLLMLAALASPEHLNCTYMEALDKGYLWHEFGDLHLILP
jgi:S-adenosylmethionine:tRNA ribosyltransferase-isomerase